MRPLGLAVLLAFAGSCGEKGDGIVVVTVDAAPSLSGVATLHVVASTSTRTATSDIAIAAPGSIPPQQSFGIDIPASVTGSLSVHVQALDANDSSLGDGDGMVTLAAGARRDIAITLSNGGGGGGLTIDRNQQSFGNVTVGQSSSSATFVVTNGGSSATGIPKLALSGTDSSQFQVTTDCSASLDAGDTCTVTAIFAPTKVGSNLSASFDVIAIPGGDVSAALSGSALAPGLLTISPAMADCGSSAVGAASPTIASFTVTNTGMAASGVPTVTTSDSQFTAAGCSSALAPSGQCTVTVQFTPSSLGSKTASLTVMATPGGAANAGLTGSGITGAVLTLSPSSYQFSGTATDGTPEGTLAGTKTFTLTNTGMSASSALGASSVGGGASSSYSVTADGCSGQVLAAMGSAGSSCNVTVSFTPKQAGINNTTLSVGGQPSTLSGHGVGTWHQEVTETGGFYWYAVRGTSASDVYVGGDSAYSSGASSIFRSTGNGVWTTQAFDTGITTDHVHALTFVDATHLFAVTWNGQILQSSGAGATWFKAAGPSASCNNGTGTCCNGGYAASPTNIYLACGVFNGTSYIQSWNGSTFGGNQTSEGTGLLSNLFGLSPNDMYATGFNGFLIQSAGTGTWTAQNPMLGTNDLRGAWGQSANDIWVVGQNSAVAHWNGTGWSALPVGTLPADSVRSSAECGLVGIVERSLRVRLRHSAFYRRRRHLGSACLPGRRHGPCARFGLGQL